MKKTLLALAVVSAATIASAEVKLSGDVTVDLGANGESNGTSYNIDSAGNRTEVKSTSDGSRAIFSDQGTELNIDASEVLANGMTAYAHIEIEGAGSFDERRLGLKGSFGDVSIGDVGSACDSLAVGGEPHNVVAPHADLAGCGDGSAGTDGIRDEGILYVGTFGPATVAASYQPNVQNQDDQVSVAVKGVVGPVKAHLAYTADSGSEVNGTQQGSTIAMGAEGTIVGATVGLQLESSEENLNGGGSASAFGYELNGAYAIGSGSVYAGFAGRSADATNAAGQTTGEDDLTAWSVGYQHNLSSRTSAWVEYGAADGDAWIYTNPANTASGKSGVEADSTAWSIGAKHAF